MRLFERMQVPCTRLMLTEVGDGEGGHESVWSAGQAFSAAVVRASTAEGADAGRLEAANAYTVTTSERLSHGDVFRRDGDGQAFRVTSNADDMAAPGCATFAFAQFAAEEWRLPDAD